MRIIVSGGGTGGHIYPAITLINNIKKLVPNAEFLYVGTKKGLEADIIPREQIPFVTLDISGFERHLTMKNFVVAGKALKAVMKARSIVKNFKPDVAIGTGGYVCGPILMAASLMGIPALIQEQNAIPGVTNKILARFVDKIAVGTGQTCTFIFDKIGIIVVNDALPYPDKSCIAATFFTKLSIFPPKNSFYLIILYHISVL